MVLKEKLLHLWHKVRSIIENKRAEASFQWIDNVLYYISGKTRICIEEHFAENGKDRYSRSIVVNKACVSTMNMWTMVTAEQTMTVPDFKGCLMISKMERSIV